MTKPLIGITMDNRRSDHALLESPQTYGRAIVAAGGVPVMLAQQAELVNDYLASCTGFLFTGGDDPCMELLGRTTHPQAIVQARSRQTFEWTLLEALEAQPEKPVLGICLGMQMMALFHGGDLHQHLPDLLGEQAADHHRGKNRHTIKLEPKGMSASTAPSPSHRELLASFQQGDMQVVSSHHQAVSHPGSLTVIARAEDDLVEMIVQPQRRFYVGVQWHPELGEDQPWNQGLFRALVRACGSRATVQAAC